MKERSEGFLSEEKIDPNGEILDYIRELHNYLWRFVRVFTPSANGNLKDFVDEALAKGLKSMKKNTNDT